MIVLHALNQALHEAMDADARVVFLGEDVWDPYGGAFRVARGLSTRFPERVWTTPVSEAGFTGLAVGMALRGFRPVVEVMFGDFLSLAFDQILNHAAKFRFLYGQSVRVPLVVRTPMGGRRGYGATHSQSLEKHFFGVPGLRVVAANTLLDPGALLRFAILMNEDPLLFVEHKLLYSCPLRTQSNLREFELQEFGTPYPALLVRLKRVPESTVTLCAYGYAAELVLESQWRLAMEYEIFADAVVYSQLSPMEDAAVVESVRRTRRLVTVEEGAMASGWGSDVVSLVCEKMGSRPFAARRIGARDLPVPASPELEHRVSPSVDLINTAVLELVAPN